MAAALNPPGQIDGAVAKRRQVRNTALRLALFAAVVYGGFIIAFVNTR